jgi:predicted Zn finger-like uncharacterized protein
MPINTDCPSCNRKLRVPDELLGKKVKCPTCGTVFQADESAAPSPAVREEDEPITSTAEEEQSPIGRPESEEEPSTPSKRRPGRDDEDDALGPPRREVGRKPDKVQNIGVMMLISGILGVIIFLGLGGGSAGFCCLWPGTYYSLVMGIMAIIKGAQLLGDKADQSPAPKGIAIMMIINIINGDIPSLVMGIICLQMLGDPEVERFFPPKP